MSASSSKLKLRGRLRLPPSFKTGHVVMPDQSTRVALQLTLSCKIENVSEVHDEWTRILRSLKIGAWRQPPEQIWDEENKQCTFYCRYFLGNPNDYKNAKEPS